MKKTILSLTAVLAISAIAPTIYATPVVGSASEVSVSFSPSVKIGHLFADITNLPDDFGSSPIFDASFAAEKVDPEYDALQRQGKVPYKSSPTLDTRSIDHHTLDSGSKKREYYYLLKGQKISVGVRYNHTSITANKPTTIYDHTLPNKELTAPENGYYYIEYAAPSSGNDQYHIIAHTRID
ncbi:hypothetical protein [Paenibacillus popilliae]|uniref:Chromosome segregation ATPase n=1 Tax=Paenibacillus popilliae ATCC 14706 TaxID=1212764 RepID=M9LIF0_PAEPP|nr:hypothetical protein [Paenibacillus popilliae]GAC42845.1 chromosome segregation ATPase [Paenibacillus popilliae ATCC 14706]